MANLRIILGTMPFGGQLNEAQSHKMMKEFIQMGYNELDTAILYQNGKTEKIIGKLHASRDPSKVKVACKANPLKGFSAESVVEQLQISLENLQRPFCDIFYLHWPDHNVPIEETLKGVNQLYKDGKFKEFGLSNYASWQVADIYHICKANGYVLPTVYQGMYNALTRDIEYELFPVLRRFGMRFYVYNPLAGGMLSGKFDFSKPDEDQPSGRFFSASASSPSDSMTKRWAGVYRDRYWKKSYKKGIDLVKSAIAEIYGSEVSLIEASMRWLRHHSCLKDDDAIIIGCSKQEHFEMNMSAMNSNEPLNEKAVNAFQDAWNDIKSDCPNYFR